MKDLSKTDKFVIAAYNAGYRVDSVGNVVRNGIIKRIYIPNRKYKYARFTMYFNKERRGVMVHKLCAYQKFGNALFENQCVRHQMEIA